MNFNSNAVLVGRNGRVWINDTLEYMVTKIELKQTGNFEDVKLVGDTATHQVFQNWTGEGTIEMVKVGSKHNKTIAEAYDTGIMPDVHIDTSIENSSTGEKEHIRVGGVLFSENPFGFESGSNTTLSLSFKFDKLDFLSEINE